MIEIRRVFEWERDQDTGAWISPDKYLSNWHLEYRYQGDYGDWSDWRRVEEHIPPHPDSPAGKYAARKKVK